MFPHRHRRRGGPGDENRRPTDRRRHARADYPQIDRSLSSLRARGVNPALPVAKATTENLFDFARPLAVESAASVGFEPLEILEPRRLCSENLGVQVRSMPIDGYRGESSLGGVQVYATHSGPGPVSFRIDLRLSTNT